MNNSGSSQDNIEDFIKRAKAASSHIFSIALDNPSLVDEIFLINIRLEAMIDNLNHRTDRLTEEEMEMYNEQIEIANRFDIITPTVAHIATPANGFDIVTPTVAHIATPANNPEANPSIYQYIRNFVSNFRDLFPHQERFYGEEMVAHAGHIEAAVGENGLY